jgi:hypothetical protein
MSRPQRRGTSWGALALREVGKEKAPLHAENRGVDRHVDIDDPRDAARSLIELVSRRMASACRTRSRGGRASRRSSGPAAAGRLARATSGLPAAAATSAGTST